MLPLPKLILNNLHKRKIVYFYRNLLNKKSGVYAFINLINGMRYIGSSKNIYKRLREHIFGGSSNKLLQKDFKKYGLNKFIFVVYAYSDNKQNLIIDLENKYISLFPFSMLYNLTPTAGSMLGYKHSEESILKMKEWSKNNNPMLGKNRTIEIREKILNSKSKPVTLYNNNNQYILTFKNYKQLANFLGCSNSTIGNYLKSGKCFKSLYYFKIN